MRSLEQIIRESENIEINFINNQKIRYWKEMKELVVGVVRSFNPKALVAPVFLIIFYFLRLAFGLFVLCTLPLFTAIVVNYKRKQEAHFQQEVRASFLNR